jgi:hypothetical protein
MANQIEIIFFISNYFSCKFYMEDLLRSKRLYWIIFCTDTLSPLMYLRMSNELIKMI